MPLRREAQAFPQQAHDAGGPPLWEMTPVEAREVAAGFTEPIGRGPDVEEVTELRIPVGGTESATPSTCAVAQPSCLAETTGSAKQGGSAQAGESTSPP
jgi:hypothetical protein